MSIDELEELEILRIFVNHNNEKFTFQSLPHEWAERVGGGSWEMVQQLIRKGFVIDLQTQEFQFTNAGKHRYKALKRKRITDCFKNIGGIITLIAAVASAVFAIISYDGCERKIKIKTLNRSKPDSARIANKSPQSIQLDANKQSLKMKIDSAKK